MTGAAGGRPGPAGRRMAGLLLDPGVPVRALAPTQDHRAEQPRQPGAEVAAGDPREIADVESWGAGNNRAASTTAASGFPDSDAPLEGSGELHPVQRAFIAHDGFQCGYCTPGQVVSAVGMLQEVQAGWPSHVTADVGAGQMSLTDEEIRERMSGNLCRCGAYANIVPAIRQAAGEGAGS